LEILGHTYLSLNQFVTIYQTYNEAFDWHQHVYKKDSLTDK